MTVPEPATPNPRSTGRRRATGGATSGATAKRQVAARRTTPPPVLVRQVRNGIVESEHRGHIVEVDVEGRVLHLLGDPDRVVTLRSTVKPFGAVALVEAGAVETWDITPAELAIMASSHSGEDLHVRTIQGLYRRAGVTQSALACGTEGMPLDELTAARLARDGERPSAIRHMCSGQHSVFLLLSKMNGWSPDGYWSPEHPAQAAYASVVARCFDVEPSRLVSAIDGCGIPTYAFPLREIARAFAMLADPAAIPSKDARSALAPALTRVRDAMLAHPEMVAGTRERLDTSLMKAAAGRVVSKGGMEALRGLAILAGARRNGRAGATGMALKIEDGDGYERATWAATIEALAQAGVLEGQALRSLGRYHRPPSLDPHGRVAAEAVPDFQLAPVGELLG
jgi:L-asparaginase II